VYGLEIQVRSSARLTFEIVQPCLLKVQIAKRKSNFCEPSPTHCPSVCPSVKRQCPMKQRDCVAPSLTISHSNHQTPASEKTTNAKMNVAPDCVILFSSYPTIMLPVWTSLRVLPSHPTAASSLLHWPKPRAATSVATRMGQRPLRNSAHAWEKTNKFSTLSWIFTEDYLSEHGLAPVEICHHELQLQATC